MGADGSGPGVIRSIAVTAEDVVDGVEARYQRDVPVVLRLTPPFSGRMRARLHVHDVEYDQEPEPLHLNPTKLLDTAAPDYPRPAETEDELRADPDVEYTVERHHDRHAAAVEEWRERVREHFIDETTIETPTGTVSVEVAILG